MTTPNIKRIIANMRSIFISDNITAVDAREIADTLEAQAKRIAELEAEVSEGKTQMREVVEAVIEFLETPDVAKQIPGARAYVFILRRALQ